MILAHCLNLLGWQGGTIHQVELELQHKAVIVETVIGTTCGIVEWIDSDEIQLLIPSTHRQHQIESGMILSISWWKEFHANQDSTDVYEGQ